MALDFPASPTVGQQFSSAGVTWLWDGQKWAASGLSVAYLPLAGGTMSGPIVLAADPAAALQAATKQYVDNGQFGGFVNRFRNGTFDVWQRGTSIAVPVGASTWTADGWFVNASGAGVATVYGGGLPGVIGGLRITGAAGNTNVYIGQRIESYVAVPLSSQRVTCQFAIQNNTSGSITPQLQLDTPTAADNFTAFTSILPLTNLQPCPAGAVTTVAYTVNMPSVANGLLVSLQFGALVSGNVLVGKADLRVTPGVPVGLNANPPPPELRPIAIERAYCQRYYWQTLSPFNLGGNAAGAGSVVTFVIPHPVTMRVAPTLSATFSGSSNCTPSASPDAQWLRVTISSTAAGNMFSTFSAGNTQSAEL